MSKAISRRKEVSCVLCGRDTLDVGAVCHVCRATFEEGKRAVAALEAEKAEGLIGEYPVAHYFQFYGGQKPDRFGRQEGERPEYRFRDAALRLGQFEKTSDHFSRSGFNPAIGELKSTDATSIPSGYRARADAVAALDELLTATRDLIAKAYAEGYGRGENLLSRIARGELSVDELEDKREKRLS